MTSTQMRADRDALAQVYALRMAAIYSAPKRSRPRLTRELRGEMEDYRAGRGEMPPWPSLAVRAGL